MEQINRIEIKGNVGTIRIYDNAGKQMASFSVVTNYLYKGRDGEGVVETMWFNVVAWTGPQTMKDFNVIKKGAAVHVVGRMREREFTGSDGALRRTTEIVANKVNLVDDSREEATA